MGIHELRKVIEAHAPKAITTHEMKDYMGRTIAIDASVSLYQFLISIRQLEGNTSLTDASGEATSHILGMFYRTIRLIVNGIKPVYVFDGKPPEEKSGELSKRKKRVQEAKEKLEEIRDGDEEGVDKEEIAKLEKRTTRVTEQQNNDIKKLCRLMGVPVVEAPSEAEAQCAALNKAGLVWATASEDMDSLTLGTNILLRYLNVAESRKVWKTHIHTLIIFIMFNCFI